MLVLEWFLSSVGHLYCGFVVHPENSSVTIHIKILGGFHTEPEQACLKQELTGWQQVFLITLS